MLNVASVRLRILDYHSTCRHLADLDLLAGVGAVLKKYASWSW